MASLAAAAPIDLTDLTRKEKVEVLRENRHRIERHRPEALDFASGRPNVSTLSCTEQKAVLRQYRQWKEDEIFARTQPLAQTAAGSSTSRISEKQIQPTLHGGWQAAARFEDCFPKGEQWSEHLSFTPVDEPAVTARPQPDAAAGQPCAERRLEMMERPASVGRYAAPPDHIDQFLTDDPIELLARERTLYAPELTSISFDENLAGDLARREHARLVAEALRAERLREADAAFASDSLRNRIKEDLAAGSETPRDRRGVGACMLSLEQPYPRPSTLGLSRARTATVERNWQKCETQLQQATLEVAEAAGKAPVHVRGMPRQRGGLYVSSGAADALPKPSEQSGALLEPQPCFKPLAGFAPWLGGGEKLELRPARPPLPSAQQLLADQLPATHITQLPMNAALHGALPHAGVSPLTAEERLRRLKSFC